MAARKPSSLHKTVPGLCGQSQDAVGEALFKSTRIHVALGLLTHTSRSQAHWHGVVHY